ncbi:MAG: hypothetical protein V4692_15870 [Bdellovibrionota bacterium]
MRLVRAASCERGSVLIEAMASTGFAALVLSGGLALCFFLFARTWLKRSAYEAAVCLATGAQTQMCERDMRGSIDLGLPVGRLEVNEFRADKTAASVRLSWSTPNFSMTAFESISLPLVKNGNFR